MRAEVESAFTALSKHYSQRLVAFAGRGRPPEAVVGNIVHPGATSSGALTSTARAAVVDVKNLAGALPGPASSAPSRVLICRPNARLGNTLLLTPLVQEIEATFPGAEIDILTAFPAAEDIFREFSCVRTIHRLPYPGAAHALRHLLTLLRASRTQYDLIIDPCPRSWSSRFAARALRGQLKIGFNSLKKRNGIDFSVPIDAAPQHMAAYPVHLLRCFLLGVPGQKACESLPRLTVRLSPAEREFGLHKRAQLTQMPQSCPTLAISTQATGAKQLRVDWWREMLRRAHVLVPTMNVIEILSASGRRGLPEYPGYFSTDLRRVAAVINSVDCFASADSGLMHLGSATDTTTVGLFRVTDPAVYAPYGGCNRALSVDTLTASQVAERIAAALARAEATCTEDRCDSNPVQPII